MSCEQVEVEPLSVDDWEILVKKAHCFKACGLGVRSGCPCVLGVGLKCKKELSENENEEHR